MSNFGLYIIGTLLVIVGLGYAAHLLGVPPVWIGIGALVLLGLGVMGGVRKTRSKE